MTSSPSAPYVSHGRGGAANLTKDDTVYADAGITREGPVGDQGDGPYSSGRGGNGNIGSTTPARTASPAVAGSATPPPAAAAAGTGTGTSAAATATTAKPVNGATRGDADYVPEQNIRTAPDNYHIGRGGEGNAHTESTILGHKGHVHEGAAERLKQKLFGKPGKP